MSLGGVLKIAAIGTILVAVVALLAPIQAILVFTRAPGAGLLPRTLWRLFLRLTGVRVTVVGRPAKRRPLLVCANHVSWLDIPVLGSLLPVSFIAKAEVGRWPVIGPLSRLQNTIFIDRTRKTATAATNQVISDRLADGDALVLFPEGTSGDGNRLLPFRSSLLGGVRDAVRRADTDDVMMVQPVALAYRGYRGLPMGRHLRPRYAWYGDMTMIGSLIPVLVDGVIEIEVRFGSPYAFTPETDRKAMTRVLEKDVRAMLIEGLTGRPRATGTDHLLRPHDSV